MVFKYGTAYGHNDEISMEPEKKHSTDLANINLDPISFFDKDADFVLAYKKTEKLASALYMVTNLFSDNEPIKWTLRKKVAELLSFMLTYKDTAGLDQSDFVYSAKSKVLEMVSFLEISFRGGLVSQMNLSVLKHEFNNLVAILNDSKTSSKNPFHENIHKAFFADNDGFYGMTDSTVSTSRIPSVIKDKENTADVDNLKRSNRQNVILGLLKKKKELNIKDIAIFIKDCSEKTIQRELNSFISLGVIKRAGVRRWSKYSLV